MGALAAPQLLRGSGQYGPRVEVPADADPQAQLIGFLGRDPYLDRSPGLTLGVEPAAAGQLLVATTSR